MLLICLAPWGPAVQGETLQQERRIEEEKRESLKPIVILPPPAAAPAALAAEQPVPLPIKQLYLAMLVPKRIAFNYDAAKAIVILMDVDEEHLDLTAQVAYLKERGFVPRRLQQTFDPMAPLRRGVAAHMFHRALGIRGGLAWHLFGPTERYALKELVFRGIMASGHPHDLISGAELVQIMSLVAQRKGQALAATPP